MATEVADRQAIADLFSEYAWALDVADWDLLRQVFHEDASLTLELTGADTVGPRAAVVDFISSTSEGQDDQRRHVVTNLRYESEGEEDAVVTATLTLLVTADGELSVQSTGVFRIEVVFEAGRWQFREFRLALDRRSRWVHVVAARVGDTPTTVLSRPTPTCCPSPTRSPQSALQPRSRHRGQSLPRDPPGGEVLAMLGEAAVVGEPERFITLDAALRRETIGEQRHLALRLRERGRLPD